MTSSITRYLSYNHDNFNDIGLELFKLALSITYADKTNRILVLNDDKYTSIMDIFIKYKYENLKMEFVEKEEFNFNIDYNETNLLINFNNFKDLSYINPNLISNKNRYLISLLITNNCNYINYVYDKINNFMIYFKDFKLENYVCMNIKKETYNNDFYEKAYYRHFNNKKLIIRTDDIEWSQTNVNFIDNSLIIFIDANEDNRFTDFILLSFFYNYIIDYDIFSWWIAYMSNVEKKVIVPFNNNLCLSDWIKQK